MGDRFGKFAPVIQLDEITTAEEDLLAELAAIAFQRGDLIYYDGTDLVRLGIGSTGQLLGVFGGIPSWGGSTTGVGDVIGPGSSTDNEIPVFEGVTGKVLRGSGVLIDDSVNLSPVTNDAGALGTSLLKWADLFLASGSVINFNAGDVAITHSANLLTISGGGLSVVGFALTADTGGSLTGTWSDMGTVTTIDINGGTIDATVIGATTPADITGLVITANTGFMPDANDGAYLGQSGTAFSDLFLASGAVINFAAGDITITHAANVITVAGGTLAVPDDAYGAGWNGSADVPTKNALYDKIETIGSTGATTALDNLAAVAINTALLPGVSDSIALGSSTKQWSDLFLGEGGVINWDDSDVTITQGNNVLTFAGATTRYEFDAALTPNSNDGAALGTAALSFADLFLATGAVLNWANGNVVMTHSSGILTVGTGEMRITTPGTHSASVATLGATQTLTAKRITKRTGTVASSATPTINTDNVDFYSITALAAAITSMTSNLSGTPTDAQTLWIAITDNGTARGITWGASFEASGTIALPTTTVISTRLDVGFVWNTVTSKWRCVAVA